MLATNTIVVRYKKYKALNQHVRAFHIGFKQRNTTIFPAQDSIIYTFNSHKNHKICTVI